MSRDTRIMSKRKQNQLLQLILLVSRGTSRLIKWIFKEKYELFLLKRKQQLDKSLQTTIQHSVYYCKLCFQFTTLCY